jgi:hypothetical protein
VIQVVIDDAIIERALVIARIEGIMAKGAPDKSLSQKGRKAVWEGAVGQAVFERAMSDLKIDWSLEADWNYDYKSEGRTVEVKTKERSVAPRPDYEASVYDYNHQRQNADWYAFVSLKFADGYNKESKEARYKYSVGWVVGCIQREDFAKVARVVEVDDPLPNGQRAGFTSHNIEFSKLLDLAALGGPENE